MIKGLIKSIGRDLVLNWYGYLLLTISFLFGIVMLSQSYIFTHNIPAELLDDIPSQIFEPKVSGYLMIAFVIVKYIGKVTRNLSVELIGIVVLAGIWFMIFVSLFYRYLHGVPSSTFLLALSMFLLCIGQSLRKDYK